MSHNSAASPFNGDALLVNVSTDLVLIHLCRDLSNILIRFAQKTLQTQQYRLNVISGRPFILQNIQANSTGEIDIGMIDRSLEKDGWWRIGIVGWKRKG